MLILLAVLVLFSFLLCLKFWSSRHVVSGRFCLSDVSPSLCLFLSLSVSYSICSCLNVATNVLVQAMLMLLPHACLSKIGEGYYTFPSHLSQVLGPSLSLLPSTSFHPHVS